MTTVLDLIKGPHLAKQLLIKLTTCDHKRTSKTLRWCADCGAIQDPRMPGVWHLPMQLDKAKILEESGAFDDSR